MPTVRGYRQAVRSPELRPVADTSIPEKPSADVYGAQVGRAVEGLGATVTRVGGYLGAEANRIHEQATLDADRAAVTAADNELYEVTRPLREQGLQLTGPAAYGATEQVRTQFDEAAGKIAGNLRTPRQQQAFQQRRAQHWESLSRELDNHGRTEYESWYKTETSKGIDNSISEAIRNAANPTELQRQLAEGRAKIQNYAAGRLGPEATAALVGDFTTKVHQGVIARFLDANQDRAAREYFAANKDAINGDALPALEKALNEGTTRGEAQRQADAITAAGGTLTEQREKAKAIEDPEVRDRVMAYLQQEHAVSEQAERERVEQSMIASANLIEQNPRKGVAAIPASVWADYTLGERTALEQYAKRNATGGVETNWGVYYALVRRATDPSQQAAFAEENLLKYRHLLGNTEFKQVTEMQAAARRRDQPKLDGLLSSEKQQGDIVNAGLRSIGLDPTPPEAGASKYDKTITDRVTLFRREVREAVARLESGAKRKATDSEVQDIVDTLTAQTVRERLHWFTPNEPARRAFEDNALVTTVADVPASERALIEDALRRAKLAVTDTAIINAFNAHLKAVRGR